MNAVAPAPVVIARARFPAKLESFLYPKRYKIAHGGRGGGKSWSFARMLLILASKKKLRILCAREIQNSIDDSVHALIKDQIELLNLQSFYKVYKNTIYGKNGSRFIYAGLHHNVDSIKSKEAVDIVWVEEAQTVSRTSWQKLIPTIRKEGSEIWVSFNPDLESDDTYQRFVVRPPSNADVIQINWRDNRWFPSVLVEDMKADRERDYDTYLHIWEGKTKQFLEGAVYRDEIRKAVEDGRICHVPYDARFPVHTFWDLGWSDLLSIWFVQKAGLNYYLIDFWQGKQTKIEQVFKVIADKGYMMGHYFLPHDAASGHLASGGGSVEDLVVEAVGDRGRVTTLPNLRGAIASGINAARTIFPLCYFDQEKCADGLQALRRYRYEIDDDTGIFSRIPVHDINSHPADAFRYFSVSINSIGEAEPQLKLAALGNGGDKGDSSHWMNR